MQKINIPKALKKKIELSKLFYPLVRKLQRRLAKILVSGHEETIKYLSAMAKSMNYIPVVSKDKYILWNSSEKSNTECMFYVINDITNINFLRDLFKIIKKYSPIFTHAFVHQKKDGEGVFDIFRFSKFSYLEHCNRVKYP